MGIIAGPTCVGKTGVSVLLARELGSEIISADSMQIYRGMDIGTEKPSPEELAAAPHHMIDICEPSEEFNAGRFVERAVPVFERLHAVGRVAIVTGGTGLYMRALTEGLFEGPEADWSLREKLMKETPEALHRKLGELDPASAESIPVGNVRRVVRALEVCIISGEPVSKLRRESTEPLPYDFIKLGLKREREELYKMIETRVDKMIKRGLVDEVRGLLDKNPSRTALQAIGYKEVIAHLNGESTLQEAVELIKRNTRRYAKRQFTWFNSVEGLVWVDVTGCASAEESYSRARPALVSAGVFGG